MIKATEELLYSMPGFLKVFGYYSEELQKWNIDVGEIFHTRDI